MKAIFYFKQGDVRRGREIKEAKGGNCNTEAVSSKNIKSNRSAL